MRTIVRPAPTPGLIGEWPGAPGAPSPGTITRVELEAARQSPEAEISAATQPPLAADAFGCRQYESRDPMVRQDPEVLLRSRADVWAP